MIAVNTSINALMAQNFSRLNEIEFNEKTERLSSGLRINNPGDDPSGLAISSGMKAQIRGISTAVHNVQDSLNLIRTVDAFIDELQEQFLEMRDIAVRLANEATMTANEDTTAVPQPAGYSDALEMYREIEMNYDHMVEMFTAQIGARVIPPPLSFNGKNIFDTIGGTVGQGFALGQTIQAGPDNSASHQMDLVIDDIAQIIQPHSYPYSPPQPPANATLSWYVGYARDQIETIDQKIDMLSDVRVHAGTMDVRLQHTINDLQAEYINISGANSTIEDADFAEEITAFTKNQIMKQSGSIAHSQATAESLITIPLLQGIYDGLLTNNQ